jgi:hypothetical protein
LKLAIVGALALTCDACGPGRDQGTLNAQTAVRKAGELTRQQALEMLSKTQPMTEVNTIVVHESAECVTADFTGRSPRFGEFTTLEIKGVAAHHELKATDFGSDTDFFRAQVNCPVPGKWYKVELTPAAKAISKDWKRGNDYYIPVQKRRVVEVTGILTEGKAGQIEYTWQWQDTINLKPSNFQRGTSQATAMIRLYDDGWRVINPGMR